MDGREAQTLVAGTDPRKARRDALQVTALCVAVTAFAAWRGSLGSVLVVAVMSVPVVAIMWAGWRRAGARTVLDARGMTDTRNGLHVGWHEIDSVQLVEGEMPAVVVRVPPAVFAERASGRRRGDDPGFVFTLGSPQHVPAAARVLEHHLGRAPARVRTLQAALRG